MFHTADFIKVFYEKLVPDTAEHKSSTLQDILAKKPTEIDALNGAVIALANSRQIAVPYNLAVYNMIKFIEAKTCCNPANSPSLPETRG
jgi:2-dehydropantoate 2-reductase